MSLKIIVGILITLVLVAIGVVFGLIQPGITKHARIQILMVFGILVWWTWLAVIF